MRFRTVVISGREGRRKSKRWQRSTIVGSTLCASVVASTKIVFGGGSSSVFRNAFQADVVHGVVGGRVHLDHVEGGPGRDRETRLALAARLERRAVHAVQRAREAL